MPQNGSRSFRARRNVMVGATTTFFRRGCGNDDKTGRCLGRDGVRTAGSVMLSGGRSASSKNISSRPPGTISVRNRPPLAPAVISCRVPRGTRMYDPGPAWICCWPTANVNSPSRMKKDSSMPPWTCGTVQTPAPPVNSARVKAPPVVASPAASTRIWMTPRLTVRPSPGATVCACPVRSIVLTHPVLCRGPSRAEGPA